jgi:hypothetical protein
MSISRVWTFLANMPVTSGPSIAFSFGDVALRFIFDSTHDRELQPMAHDTIDQHGYAIRYSNVHGHRWPPARCVKR